jgi:hypothetical protein
MAEVFKIEVEGDISAFYVFDTTGKFNASNNLTGWGLPNLQTSDVLTAQFQAWAPRLDPAVDLPVTFDVHPYLPNDENKGREVLATDLGLADIESGVWNFKVLLTTATGVIEAIYQCYYDAKILCCIAKKKLKIEPCTLEDESTKKTMELEVLAENAAWSYCNGDIDAANDLAKYIQLQCDCCC